MLLTLIMTMIQICMRCISNILIISGADPELVVGGGVNPLGGVDPIYLYIF